ncbi:MAG: carboxymuconolactone decarboxylase family protein [Chlorobi bacterium]|nr:carboxymuconolactone decarboxylase family protein [Chlorobiota bacterium]
MKKDNPLEIFKREAPEIQQAYAGVIKALIASNGLDAKTKQLVYIAMKVVADDRNAIKYHVPLARAAGATRDEVKDVILLSLTVNGLKGISMYLPEALEAYDGNQVI